MCDGCDHCNDVNFITAAVSGYNQFARFACDFHSEEGYHDAVGGHICQLYARTIPNASSNLWTFVWKDCLGDEHEDGGTGTIFEKSDFDAQWFCITSTLLFAACVTMDGPSLCGVA